MSHKHEFEPFEVPYSPKQNILMECEYCGELVRKNSIQKVKWQKKNCKGNIIFKRMTPKQKSEYLATIMKSIKRIDEEGNTPYDPNFGYFIRCDFCGSWIHPETSECDNCHCQAKIIDEIYCEEKRRNWKGLI